MTTRSQSKTITINSPTYTTVTLTSHETLVVTKAGLIDPSAAGATGVSVAAKLNHVVIRNAGIIDGGAGAYNAKTAGSSGGTAVDALSAIKLNNSGTITGGTGGSGYGGGTGGTAIDMAGGNLSNTGTIAGGTGGYSNIFIAGAGTGGTGVSLDSGRLTNAGVIKGGTGGYQAGFNASGGNGGTGLYLFGAAAAVTAGIITGGAGAGGIASGGSGGVGVSVSGSASLTSTGSIHGGNGGGGAEYFGGNGGAGVVFESSGTLTNGGTITGGAGAYAGGRGFAGSAGDGVRLSNTGTLLNTGTIAAGSATALNIQQVGIGVAIQGGDVTNTGTILGGNDADISTGGYGVLLDGGTLTTSGLISGGRGANGALGDAVQFQPGATGTLVVDPGATFQGNVVASYAGDALILGGTTAGTIAAIGPDFIDFSTITSNQGSDWQVQASSFIGKQTALGISGTLDFQVSVIDNGTVSVSAGGVLTGASATFVGSVTNNGTVADSSGAFSFSALISGTGALNLSAGGTLALLAGAASGQTVDFGSGGGLLELGTPLDFAGTIAGFASGDTIDLLSTPATALSYANQVLTVKDNTQVVAKLTFEGNYTTKDFALTSDQHGGTNITFK
jgi:hypothetical protein